MAESRNIIRRSTELADRCCRYGFVVYQDPSVTDVACAGLNGMRMGERVLTVRRATDVRPLPLHDRRRPLVCSLCASAQQGRGRSTKRVFSLPWICLSQKSVSDPFSQGKLLALLINSSVRRVGLLSFVLSVSHQSFMALLENIDVHLIVAMPVECCKPRQAAEVGRAEGG